MTTKLHQNCKDLIVAFKSGKLGRTAELLVYHDEGHGLAKLKNRLDAYPKVLQFFEQIFGR